MSSSNWSELFIKGRTSIKKLATLVLGVVDGTITDKWPKSWTVESTFISIDVEYNKRRREPRMPNDAEFLFYPFLIFFEPLPDAPQEVYEEQVRTILRQCRELGLQITLVADFEEE